MSLEALVGGREGGDSYPTPSRPYLDPSIEVQRYSRLFQQELREQIPFEVALYVRNTVNSLNEFYGQLLQYLDSSHIYDLSAALTEEGYEALHDPMAIVPREYHALLPRDLALLQENVRERKQTRFKSLVDQLQKDVQFSDTPIGREIGYFAATTWELVRAAQEMAVDELAINPESSEYVPYNLAVKRELDAIALTADILSDRAYRFRDHPDLANRLRQAVEYMENQYEKSSNRDIIGLNTAMEDTSRKMTDALQKRRVQSPLGYDFMHQSR